MLKTLFNLIGWWQVAVFAEGLVAELETLRVTPGNLGGLYGKWAPSVGKSLSLNP